MTILDELPLTPLMVYFMLACYTVFLILEGLSMPTPSKYLLMDLTNVESNDCMYLFSPTIK